MMADTAKLSDQAERGAHAERLKNDPLLNEFLDAVQEGAIEAICESAAYDADVRERAYYAIEAIKTLKGLFAQAIGEGKHAVAELTKKQIQPKENDGA